MAERIKSYIDDLFRYIDIYESNFSEFKPEAFFQTYNGIYTVFQTLREQREQAVEIDQYFLEKIKSHPLTSSDLRQITIQLLITYFESEADTDGQSNKAWLYCRDLRPIKRDVAYFEEHLVPMLFREGSLNNDFRLNSFFLKEIGRYVSKFARGVKADLTPEEFNAMPDSLKILELSRRRMELGEDLLSDRTSLEFQLQGMGILNKLSEKNKLFEKYLSEWNYLIRESFWGKVKVALSEAWAKIKGLFSSYRYFKLALTQRKPAYIFYGVLILLFS